MSHGSRFGGVQWLRGEEDSDVSSEGLCSPRPPGTFRRALGKAEEMNPSLECDPMSSSSNSSISYFEQHRANLNKVALFVLGYSAEEVTSVKSYRTEPGTQARLGESGLSYRPAGSQLCSLRFALVTRPCSARWAVLAWKSNGANEPGAQPAATAPWVPARTHRSLGGSHTFKGHRRHPASEPPEGSVALRGSPCQPCRMAPLCKARFGVVAVSPELAARVPSDPTVREAEPCPAGKHSSRLTVCGYFREKSSIIFFLSTYVERNVRT